MTNAARQELDNLTYGPRHREIRSRYKPIVLAGGVKCAKCHELIRPGQPWDLGHVDGDRSPLLRPRAPPLQPGHSSGGSSSGSRRRPSSSRSAAGSIGRRALGRSLAEGPAASPEGRRLAPVDDRPPSSRRRLAGAGGRQGGREALGHPPSLVAEAGRGPRARGRRGRRARLGDGRLVDGPPARQVLAPS